MPKESDSRLAQAIAVAREKVSTVLPPAEAKAAAQFTSRFLDSAIPEDLAEETPDNLFGLATTVWEHVRFREPGTTRVRAYNPDIEEHGWYSRHTVVEIATDNNPFLLDSTLAALNQLAITIHLVIHPIFQVCRDGKHRVTSVHCLDEADADGQPESIIHVQVTRQNDSEVLERIVSKLQQAHADIRAAVEDWPAMVARVEESIDEVKSTAGLLPEGDVEEGVAFLEWLRDNNFTFLGARDYVLEDRRGKTYFRASESKGLGVLRELGEASRKRHKQSVTEHFATFLRRQELFVISKAWTRSNIHRPVYMDYIGVRRFDRKGKVIGERRFLGLLTSTAYNTRPTRIPLLRKKVETVLERSGFTPGNHDAKALRNILESMPRDELFQIGLNTLADTALGILRLAHSQRVRLFLRRDGYSAFYSALVFVPRDVYSTSLRARIGEILQSRLHGDSVEIATQYSEAPMVRAHFIVHISDVGGDVPDIDAIEQELADAARNWNDDFLQMLIEEKGEAEGASLFRRHAKALPEHYKANFPPRAAVGDIKSIVMLKAPDDIALNLYRRVAAAEHELDFKVYRAGPPIPLSSILPMLEHMGIVVLEERSYSIPLKDPDATITIHDFRIASRHKREIDLAETRARFEKLFSDVWHGQATSDNFNNLVLDGLDGREITLLRAYARYLRQIKVPFSLAYMQETLAAHPGIVRLLINKFYALHDPEMAGDPNKAASDIRTKIQAELDAVAAADQDRILRAFLNLAEATLRTNFFQRDENGNPRPAIALKFDCAAIPGLPSPRPWREVFVFNPYFEAVHLRGGPVARGGIRWSDRREDYRTEILGLMKAQSVKNAVIVPVGAKGGFALTRPPPNGNLREEALRCYRIFMASLLDVTDDFVDGKPVPRQGQVRHDGDDPYLVVAADKGTATFSDEANAVAESYGYWLGDAFASGGSAGYDHKAMGITARGAWEAVKRHFRELGHNTQLEDFTVVGIGDMSGDVFGNGMLLSPHIRLIGAFNHLHIFLDPNPDAASSHEERARLFALPRSTWEDYDARLISKGGGVFSRKAKNIALTPEIQQLLGVRAEQMPPDVLIRAMLMAEVDMLWNGGIGTYIKACAETNADADDRTNDAVRVSVPALRCKVIAEGGNLGVTQAARVEFASRGGKINSDAIDNAAGVDCSDHEVNIKILLNSAVAAGDMTRKQRNQRLASMTDEVASMVLRHNYLQTQCLSVMEHLGKRLFEEQVRFLDSVRLSGKLSEQMPDEEELNLRRTAGLVFTRPELAVLLACAKIFLFDDLVASPLPDNPYLVHDLQTYFPEPLRVDFADAMQHHRLRREIIATVIANRTIERAGITFIHRHVEHSGITAAAVTQAFLLARDVFDLEAIWRAIEATDNAVATDLQGELHGQVMHFLDRMTSWFLRYVQPGRQAQQVIDEYRKGVVALESVLDQVLSPAALKIFEDEEQALIERGTPPELARIIARLDPLSAACDIVEVARQSNIDPASVSPLFFAVGYRYGCNWLRTHTEYLPQHEHWDRLAAQAITEDSYAHQRTLTSRVLTAGDSNPQLEEIDLWAKKNGEAVHRFESIFGEIMEARNLDLATLNVANRALRVLTEVT